MKTLFLGSSGFIGQPLLRALQDEGGITTFSRKIDSDLSPGINQIIGDYSNKESLLKLSEMKFDRVIDCSWSGLPDLSEKNNVNNYHAKQLLLNIFSKMGVSEINSFGSCLEYGTQTGEISEDSLGEAVSDFGITKRLILEDIRSTGIKFRWFRPFYLIGERQHGNSLIHAAVRSISEGLDFEPREPHLMFDFISISDAIKGAISAIQNENCLGIINLGTGINTSVNQIVNLVREYYGMPQRHFDGIPGLVANCDKLRSMTGWVPEQSISDAVRAILPNEGRL